MAGYIAGHPGVPRALKVDVVPGTFIPALEKARIAGSITQGEFDSLSGLITATNGDAAVATEALGVISRGIDQQQQERAREQSSKKDQEKADAETRTGKATKELVEKTLTAGATVNINDLRSSIISDADLAGGKQTAEGVRGEIKAKIDELTKAEIERASNFNTALETERTKLDSYVSRGLLSRTEANTILSEAVAQNKQTANRLIALYDAGTPEETIRAEMAKYNPQIRKDVEQQLQEKAARSPKVKTAVEQMESRLRTDPTPNDPYYSPSRFVDNFASLSQSEQAAIKEEFDKYRVTLAEIGNTFIGDQREGTRGGTQLDAIRAEINNVPMPAEYRAILIRGLDGIQNLEASEELLANAETAQIQAEITAEQRKQMWIELKRVGKILGPTALVAYLGLFTTGGLGAIAYGKGALTFGTILAGGIAGTGVAGLTTIGIQNWRTNPEYRKQITESRKNVTQLNAELERLGVAQSAQQLEGLQRNQGLVSELFQMRGMKKETVEAILPDYLGSRGAANFAALFRQNSRRSYARAA